MWDPEVNWHIQRHDGDNEGKEHRQDFKKEEEQSVTIFYDHEGPHRSRAGRAIREYVRRRRASTTTSRHLLTNFVASCNTSMIELEALLELAMRRIPWWHNTFNKVEILRGEPFEA